MPNLARLVREGRSGILRTFQPPLSPLVWTTMMTGTSPLQHRILDFTRFNPASGVREPITSDERLEKAVWEMAGDHGRDVAVFGMWATHPAEPVRGLMVSERLFAILKHEDTPPGVVHPAGEQPRVLAERAKVESEVSLAALQAYLPWLTKAEFEYLEGGGDPYLHPVTMLRRILIETRLYHRLAVDWVRRAAPALTVVYFEGTDSIGHVFAAFAPPQQPGIDAKDFQRYQSVPRDYFREVDGMLGEYRALAEETGAALFIVSDHGFLWHEGRPRSSGIAGRDGRALASRRRASTCCGGRASSPTLRRARDAWGRWRRRSWACSGCPGRRAPMARPWRVSPRCCRRRITGRARRGCSPPTDSGPAGDAVERLKALGYVGSNEPADAPAVRRFEHPDGRVVHQRGLAPDGGRQGRRGEGGVRTGAAPRPEERRGQVRPRLAAREGRALRGGRRPAARRAGRWPRRGTGEGRGDCRRGLAAGRCAAGARGCSTAWWRSVRPSRVSG